MLDVRVDRALGQEEPPGDLPVAEPVGDQPGDLSLTPGKRPCLTARRAVWPGAGYGQPENQMAALRQAYTAAGGVLA